MMRYSMRWVGAFTLVLLFGSFIAFGFGIFTDSDTRLKGETNEAQDIPSPETDTDGIRPLCAWRTRDVCAPLVEMTLPNGGEVFKGTETIKWIAFAFNGETLNQDLYYSPDGGEEWVVIATGLKETSFYWDTTNVPDGSNYLIRVVVHGDVTGGRDQSDAVFNVANMAGTISLSNPIEPSLVYVISAVVGLFVVIAVMIMRRKQND
ncbi:MAG: hypothetical protein PVI03_06645 [Candidatus Thorarchaeota archaeon]